MADPQSPDIAGQDLRRRVLEALQTGMIRLKRDERRDSEGNRRSIMGANPCTDLWDDQLELIELLMEMEAELGVTDRLDWQKAPKSTATVFTFIDWTVEALSNG